MTPRWSRAGAAVVIAAACTWPALTAAQGAADLERARAAVERREFDTALALYERLLRIRAHDADLWIEAARVSGFADRNAEAAARYRRVLDIAPARRADVLPSLAWQTLWSGDAASAASLFDEATRTAADRAEAFDGLGQARNALGDAEGAIVAWRASLALRPAQPALERRLARALMWQGRHGEADALLAQTLQRDGPDRGTAWLRVKNWNLGGRHHDAAVGFERLGGPTNADERFDVAKSWAWSGFDERALALLADTDDEEARWWRDHRVRRETQPFADAAIEHSTDADDLDSTRVVAGFGWRASPGSTARLALRSVELRSPDARSDGRELHASWRRRFGAPGEAGGVWWPSFGLRASHWDGWSPWTGDARVTWVPRDGWRVDAEAARGLVETPKAIAERVTVGTLALGVDHRPDHRASLALGLAALRFDDGNRRERVYGRADWRLPLPLPWRVGVEAMAFDSSRPTSATVPDRGYWNPASYREARLFTAIDFEQRPWDVAARLALGTSREVDGDGVASRGRPHLWELAVGRDLGATARVRAVVGGSGSGFGLAGGGSGYWRRYASLNLQAWF